MTHNNQTLVTDLSSRITRVFKGNQYIALENSRIGVVLTKGKLAIIDAEDYPKVSSYTWHARKGALSYYASRSCYAGGKQKTIMMHVDLLPKREGYFTDHKDRNGLNNVGSNLRYATRSENQGNRLAISRQQASKYKGVSISPAFRSGKSKKKWLSGITVKAKFKYLGIYLEEIDAAYAYDVAALKYFGEFACVNFASSEQLVGIV